MSRGTLRRRPSDLKAPQTAPYLAHVGHRPAAASTRQRRAWRLAARWGDARHGGLDLWLDQAAVLPAGLGVAQTWGALMTGARRRGRPRPQNDTWIAACCIESGLPLVTFNRRDFVDFAEHDGLVLL